MTGYLAGLDERRSQSRFKPSAGTSSAFVMVGYCARTPQKPSNRFPGRRSRQSTPQRANRVVVAAEPTAGRAALSLDYAGRLRTLTDARHDLQGKHRLLRH
jgi:hypothetical protein